MDTNNQVIIFIILITLFFMAILFFIPGCGSLKREGFTGPAMITKSLGGYNRLCKIGKDGIWFDCSRGAGRYYWGGTQSRPSGFYSDYNSDGTELSGLSQPKTPSCMSANCGRFDEPKNVQGCGCTNVKQCCGRDRGCPQKI